MRRAALPLLLIAAALPAAAQTATGPVVLAEQACASTGVGNGSCTVRFTAQPGTTYYVRMAMVAGPAAKPGMMATMRPSVGACGMEFAIGEGWLRPDQTARMGSYTHPRTDRAATLCAVVAIYRCGDRSGLLDCDRVVNMPSTKVAIIQD